MPLDPTDAPSLVRALAAEVEARRSLHAPGELVNFAAWVHVRLTMLAEQLDDRPPPMHGFPAPQQRRAPHLN